MQYPDSWNTPDPYHVPYKGSPRFWTWIRSSDLPGSALPVQKIHMFFKVSDVVQMRSRSRSFGIFFRADIPSSPFLANWTPCSLIAVVSRSHWLLIVNLQGTILTYFYQFLGTESAGICFYQYTLGSAFTSISDPNPLRSAFTSISDPNSLVSAFIAAC